MATKSTTSRNSASLSAWQARSLHIVNAPSGQRLKIRIPGIATLLQKGDLSEGLFDIATAEVTDTISAEGLEGPVVISGAVQWVTKSEQDAEKLERMASFGRFQRELVCAAVVAVETEKGWQDVSLSVDDLDALPEDDLAMVAEIVQRIRGRDAKGVRIGVEPLDRWATFRDEHECPEDCASCARVLDAFSSVDVGAM